MKNIRWNIKACLSATLVALCGLTSCNKSWLAPKPLSIYTPQNAYTTASALQDALVACERNLRYEFYGDGSPIITQMIFSGLDVDGTTDKSGPAQNMNISITPDAITAKNDNADHNRIYWFWEQSYYRIKYANTVLAYIDIPKWDTTKPDQVAQRNALIGSAYFFRAYSYYDLVNCFGNVPYAGKLYNSPKLDFQTVDRKVILQEMQKELELAVQWVADTVPKGEVTKGACQHLLAKVDLALGDFDGAIQAATDVINGGYYHLMTDRFGQDASDASHNVIWDLHQPLNKTLPENREGLMYVVDLDGYKTIGADYGGGISTMRQASPNWYVHINTPNGHPGTTDQKGGKPTAQCITMGRGIGRCRPQWYSANEVWAGDDGDLRHAPGNWVDMDDYVYNNPALEGVDPYYGKPLQLYNDAGQLLCSDTIRDWFSWPYYKLYVTDNENLIPTGGHTPWYVFRLAATYLVRAEAYWWKGDLADAAADINVVRARAGAKPISPDQVNIATILDERARELYYEEPRKEEMTRMAYLFAQTGKPDYKGRIYTMADFSTRNFWYDRIMDVTNFYNKGVKTPHGDEYTMSPYHVLWPVPQSAIDANVDGHINQNLGYTGSETNVPPLEALPKDD